MINENENSFKDGEKDYIFAYTTPIMVQQQD
jgi:hypothetical protein